MGWRDGHGKSRRPPGTRWQAKAVHHPGDVYEILDVPQSGHLGTYISFKTRHGQSRRRYVIPRNPRSPAQMRIRSRIRNVAGRWRER